MVVIVRCGRDVAISAGHIRRLHALGDRPCHMLLDDWTHQVFAVAATADAGKITVLRYEDLSLDFVGTCGRMLE